MRAFEHNLVRLIIAANLTAPLVHAGDLVIGADVSASVALVSSQDYADAVAQQVYRKVITMEYGDRVVLKTLGDGGIQHVKGQSLQITRQMPPQRAASQVAAAIRDFPNRGQSESSTNVLGFLENNRFDCTSEGAAVWLLTDAIEQSAEVSGNALLQGKPLPAPFAQTLEGCEVVMIGVGRLAGGGTLPRSQLQALKTAWTDWLTLAGATTITLQVNP
ncbi:Uncharacterised protein [Halioglobus japonicus]|nr:Uncharacterised protein [Halioglobus japonicus]